MSRRAPARRTRRFALVPEDDPTLRQAARPIRQTSPEGLRDIDRLVVGMRSVMMHNQGVGLAAPQVGVPWRLFIYELPTMENPQTILNPEIVERSDEYFVASEGCLSLPGHHSTIRRPKRVLLKGSDQWFKPVEIEATGLLARVFCHEVDHLNGVLITDGQDVTNRPASPPQRPVFEVAGRENRRGGV